MSKRPTIDQIILHIRDGAPESRAVRYAEGVYFDRLGIFVMSNASMIGHVDGTKERPGFIDRIRLRIALSHWKRTHST